MTSLHDRPIERRAALRSMSSGLAAMVAAPVLLRAQQCAAIPLVEELGRLRTRHSRATEPTRPGTYPLGLRRDRDGVLYLPPQYSHDAPIPLVLLLHGAGGTGVRVAQRFKSYADDLGIAFVAPDSTAVSWDRNDRLASDVEFIDRALAVAFRRVNTTPDRLRIGGFSDGASYSLSVGLTNGDLFSRILALSPGFCGPAQPRGKPELYFTHGTRDDILPIDVTSRKIVPMLQRAGYSVEYHEFDGKHETPPAIARPGFEWLIKS
ncbi:MAG: alpha/beta hydrolase [Gemmatimonadaceae bacterium]